MMEALEETDNSRCAQRDAPPAVYNEPLAVSLKTDSTSYFSRNSHFFISFIRNLHSSSWPKAAMRKMSERECKLAKVRELEETELEDIYQINDLK
jgi:hypothetical protein